MLQSLAMNVSFIILHAGLHNQIIFSVTDNSAMQKRYNISKLIRLAVSPLYWSFCCGT